jgi:hypothetical protein
MLVVQEILLRQHHHKGHQVAVTLALHLFLVEVEAVDLELAAALALEPKAGTVVLAHPIHFLALLQFIVRVAVRVFLVTQLQPDQVDLVV